MVLSVSEMSHLFLNNLMMICSFVILPSVFVPRIFNVPLLVYITCLQTEVIIVYLEKAKGFKLSLNI